MRISDGYIPMQAGPEIGVASTKAFTTSLTDQYLLALALGQLRGTLTPERQRSLVDDLAQLPNLAGQVLDHDSAYEALAGQFYKAHNFLYLGRGINFAVARKAR
jgi:glutamine---fructose-6-phosphate transaminase (isomerizing)